MNKNSEDDFVEPLPGVASTYLSAMRRPRSSKEVLDKTRTETKQDTERSVLDMEDFRQPGYGSDPNMIHPVAPWGNSLTEYQRRQICRLADIILPGERSRPSPSQLGIDGFFDEWLSAPYEDQKEQREQILDGLLRLEEMATAIFGTDFLELKESQIDALLKRTIADQDNGLPFFKRLRYLVVSGYVTSDEGMRTIGYRGNLPLRRPAKVSQKARALIEVELKKLGL